jgi:cyclopropane fatty-acyl-phospholipid synthase-like methyltransferase
VAMHKQDKNILSSKEYWGGRKSGSSVESSPFESLFQSYLEKAPGRRCIEIGCVPGNFLAYISKTFEYFPEGIDYVNDAYEIVAETLENNDIYDYRIYEDDFFLWENQYQYDLVCSFGFIEHFSGELLDRAIRKTVSITKQHGKIILEVPNFRYGQYLLHFMLDKDNIAIHNTKIMEIKYFKNLASQHGLKILHVGYSGGPFKFWSRQKDMRRWQRVLYRQLKRMNRLCEKRLGERLNNRLFSPYIILIAERM